MNSNHCPNSSTAKGFTLIELLVVIAIIAILAAILFPVFAQAKLAAKKTVSLSNVKQINLACMMYANDYDDTFVPAALSSDDLFSWAAGHSGAYVGVNVGGEVVTSYGWDYAIQPYVKSGNAASLTSAIGLDYDPGDLTGPTHSWAFGGYTNAATRSYGINGAIIGSIPAWGYTGSADTGPGSGPGGNATTNVPDPAGTILVAEIWSQGNVTGNFDDAEAWYPAGSYDKTDCDTNDPNAPGGLHTTSVVQGGYGVGWNYGFSDGHAKFMDPHATYTVGKTLYSDAVGNDNGNDHGATTAQADGCTVSGMWTIGTAD